MKIEIVKMFLPIMICLNLSSCVPPAITTNANPNYNKAKIKSITVLDISEPQNIFADILATEMLGLGYKLIERSQLNKLLSEQKLSLGGILKNQDYYKIGEITNIDAIVLVSAKIEKNMIMYAVVKMIDISTGEVICSTNYERRDNYTFINTVAKHIVKDISSKLLSQ